jgi:hypothetical protein
VTRRKAEEPAEGALDDIGDALDNAAPAPTLAMAGERAAGQDEDDAGSEPFPRDCPVKPLGASSSIDGVQRCYYLNTNGEIVGLEAGNKHGKNNLIALFGKHARFLEQEWPRWSEPKRNYDRTTKSWVEVQAAKIVGFDQAKASQALITECYRLGIFDPTGRMRGRGAHPLAGGGLALHVGDAVAAILPRANGGFKALDWHDTGLHDRMVYPAAMPTPRPWPESVPPSAAIKVAEIARTWNWKRPALDPILLLGAIGQGFISGALPWRSNVWITGGRGTGKSTLNGQRGLIDLLYGEAIFRTSNTSAAAIRQMLRNSTVPVLIDEAEPGANGDNRKITEVVELARVASSGGTMYRGGQDHTAHEFTMHSAFWFSSINIPPMEASDRSRLAILELKPLRKETAQLDLHAVNWPDIGRKLMRRMLDGWPMLAETRKRYHEALSQMGHESRACDQFGNLLACAWVALNDELPDSEEVADWAMLCAPERLAEVNDAVSDEERCLTELLTHQVQPRGRDSREAISTLIGRAVHAMTGDPIDSDSETPRKALEQIGLKLVNLVAKDGPEGKRWGVERGLPGVPLWLAVSNTHKGVSEIYASSKWAGGVHRQTLSRITVAPGVQAMEGLTVNIARLSARTVLVPLAAVLHADELPAASAPARVAEWIAAQGVGT